MTRGQEILKKKKKNNQNDDMLFNAYNISSSEHFDAVIIAPVWTPFKIGFPIEGITVCKSTINVQSNNPDKIPMMKKSKESYIIDWNGLRLGWLITGTCAGNVIDSTLFLSDTATDRLIFLGSAGGLTPDVSVGEVTTPSCCVDCVGATQYFADFNRFTVFDSIIEANNPNYVKQITKLADQQGISLSSRKVFCTDSILGEYLHMDRIQGVGAEIIEMETSAFYCAAKLMEKSAVAFLVVSDNSSIGKSFSAPYKKDFEHYNQIIRSVIPKLLQIACEIPL